ncbi:MAG: 3-phosphoshikimate 1-carboxyvinyltransferase [Alphaproteobacteria bacterium]|nr:3-phosphoshikimate 1-carboxyvinyltransferase [Alphaproteobacteria bacterium]
MKNIENNIIVARNSNPLQGTLDIPGDKSISHRALMLGAITIGETIITGLLEGDDVQHTASALRCFGVKVRREGIGKWRINGVGIGGLISPNRLIDVGNSGTSARLLCGLISGHGFSSMLTGDNSLCSRPMVRVIEPLMQMGATFHASEGDRLPMTITGNDNLMPISYKLPIASAQVKSAILLAGLHAPGATSVIESRPTRDHTERMLRYFGADITVEEIDAGNKITVIGQPELTPALVTVPADPSSAAFPVVAALIVKGSKIKLSGVCKNPTRIGIYTTLLEMGASLEWKNERQMGGETVADLYVKSSELIGVTVPADRAPSMIDEYPVLAMAAACASGSSIFCGVGELRFKESDRIAAIVSGLTECGISVEVDGDSLIIHGSSTEPAGGATINALMDHRIAMSFLVLGLKSKEAITIDEGSSINTSFPNFIEIMRGIGADIS